MQNCIQRLEIWIPRSGLLELFFFFFFSPANMSKSGSSPSSTPSPGDAKDDPKKDHPITIFSKLEIAAEPSSCIYQRIYVVHA